MSFFKPEDFKFANDFHENFGKHCAEVANAKLKREGKLVYNYNGPEYSWLEYHPDKNFTGAKHKALLINLEPIETCKHPEDKVQYVIADCASIPSGFFCKCGVQVTPESFKEINK